MLASTILGGCQKSYEEKLYERYMDAELDAEESNMIRRGMLQYSVTHSLPKTERITIKRLAETAFIEPVFAKSEVRNRFVWVAMSGDVLIVKNIVPTTEE
ncbi:MAG: hypothetical protein JJV99_06220 [Colwellia sp.]|nr:hypothetical protein [Colwellia sp.]